MGLIERLRHRLTRHRLARQPDAVPAAAFDAAYYLARYPDVAAEAATADAAAEHYRVHGRAEGRFATRAEENAAVCALHRIEPHEFDLVAYRLLNPDLAATLTRDREFIVHFARHGRDEGRPATFTADRSGRAGPAWRHVFCVPHFMHWQAEWRDPPRTRRAALARFENEGIDRLDPIRFDLAFDPQFYRDQYRPDAAMSPADLYREWLAIGLPAGRAPNEATLLRPYLGELTWPERFDWRGYAATCRLPASVTRSEALIHLYESETGTAQARRFWPDDRAYVEVLARFLLRHDRASEAEAMVRDVDCEDDPSAAGLLLRAEIANATGRPNEALIAWSEALRKHDQPFATLQAAVDAASAASAFEAAFALLLGERDRWRGSGAFEALADRFHDRWFKAIDRNAKALLIDGDRVQDMNDATDRSLRRLSDAIAELMLPSARLGPTAGGPALLLGDHSVCQCTHYRIEQKQDLFEAADIPFASYDLDATAGFIEALPGARAAIFYRVQATPGIIAAILTARSLGIPTYYEIDDLLFRHDVYPPARASFDGMVAPDAYRGLQFSVPLFRHALALCDRAVASTPALLAQMRPIVREQAGFVLRNGLDSRSAALLAADGLDDSAPCARIRVLYGSGTLAHADDFANLLAPALATLLERCEQGELVLVGHVPDNPVLRPHADRIKRIPLLTDIQAYWTLLAQCEIAVAVLGSGPVEDCKSEIKWLEAAAAAIPTVASATATFRDVIVDGQNGLLATTVDEWRDQLLLLAGDPILRRRIGAEARRVAIDRYGLGRGAEAVTTAFASPPPVVTPPSAEPERTPARVLCCNVFFDPQSIGGATRVVEDNVADIAATSPDIALAVFCSDDTAAPHPRFRTSRFGGIPVFRIGVRTSAAADEPLRNPEVLAAFRRTLDQFRPDLVHFHCLQRLTVTIVEECRRRGIPYVVTLHDGWWLSRDQFFVDKDGFLRLPTATVPADLDRGAGIDERSRVLEDALRGAARITTVSEKFAAIYRSAGFPEVCVVRNGLPPFDPATPRPNSVGPIRLAHIGGRDPHKGSDLVEAAFRRNPYPNLSLLMIDHRLSPGAVVETRWGDNRVTIAAAVPQRRIADLYAALDVVLAPSQWPESYGLVAREAARAGLWTVTATIGAIGDDLVEGANGYLIDTSHRAPLDTVLRRIDGAPDAFRRGTALGVPPRRSAHEQALEFAELYRTILTRART